MAPTGSVQNDIEEVTSDRVRGTKEHSDHILKSDFETMIEIQDFERENISMSLPTFDSKNISMSRPTLESTPNVFNTKNGTMSSIDSIPIRKKRKNQHY